MAATPCHRFRGRNATHGYSRGADHRPHQEREFRPVRGRRPGAAAHRHPDPVVRPLPATGRGRIDKRTVSGLEGVLRKSSPSRATTRRSAWSTSSTSWASPGTTPTSAGNCGSPTAGRSGCGCGSARPDGNAVEEEVYLGDMPIMIGGGEFIINGAERVVVSQLHRSPGVDFVVEREAGQPTCTRAASSRSGGAGSRSTAPRRTRSASASTSPASSRP